MHSILRFICRFVWGQRFTLRLMCTAGNQFFSYIAMWPADGEYVRAAIFAHDKFHWDSCMSSYTEDSARRIEDPRDVS